MVTQCSNPSCAKPLHYLREGRVVLIEIKDADKDRRLEHFWLCGPCSKIMSVTSDGLGGTQINSKIKSRRPAPLPEETPLAS